MRAARSARSGLERRRQDDDGRKILEGHRQRTSGESACWLRPGAPGAASRNVSASCCRDGGRTCRCGTDDMRLLPAAADHRPPSAARRQGSRPRRASSGCRAGSSAAWTGIGLAGDPELVFLDEPTTGFRPGGPPRRLGDGARLQDLGKTIFLTTHMEEAGHSAAASRSFARAKSSRGPRAKHCRRDQLPRCGSGSDDARRCRRHPGARRDGSGGVRRWLRQLAVIQLTRRARRTAA